MKLSEKKCAPCEGGVPPLQGETLKKCHEELKNGWEVIGQSKIKKEFNFRNFREAVVFVNKVAAVAEHERHHPDILILYSRVIIELWTHAIRGLSENDFIVAAKVDAMK